ncbi:hypothetical protein C2I06_07895 [Niallia circulans]|uniref:Transposase DDE domain-containing protein n=1 Tax=Niallia circulans TaxID=1397 RepID=A0A268F9L6_NIACI|nr:transposase [Niallia circulans]AYV66803.1 hypothetical protein C2I06_07895 [Niallia circulans]AYV70342.1 hypothetical protein C2H98_01465 [Niallia circulans]PAD82055.1 hypothetical protein CHH57_16755 [Niallia circulans]
MKSVLETNLSFNKRVKVNFEGGDLTSDSGLLLYKEFDEKLGITEMINIREYPKPAGQNRVVS